MPRVRRTFYTARRKTAKWSPHLLIQPISFETGTGDFASYQLVAKNSTDTTVPVPSVIKVKNFRVSIDTSAPVGAYAVDYFNVYLMYVPEGITINTDTPKNHPEWIITWKGIDNSTGNGIENIVMSSRLARNLNSGDGIYLIFAGYNSLESRTFKMAATTTYVSRAN